MCKEQVVFEERFTLTSVFIQAGYDEKMIRFLLWFLSAALLALRSSAEFKKKAVWTRAYGW